VLYLPSFLQWRKNTAGGCKNQRKMQWASLIRSRCQWDTAMSQGQTPMSAPGLRCPASSAPGARSGSAPVLQEKEALGSIWCIHICPAWPSEAVKAGQMGKIKAKKFVELFWVMSRMTTRGPPQLNTKSLLFLRVRLSYLSLYHHISL